MNSEPGCEQVRPMLAELALGTVEGRQRAHALAHLAGCPDCRAELDRFAALADELLLLAPPREPSPGFEGRVLATARGRLGARRTRRRRVTAPALAATLAAIVTALALTLGSGDDRELAQRYRETLEAADGRYFTARELYAAGEIEVGHVFGYEGSPSWVFVVVEPDALDSPRYAVEAVTDAGRRIELGRLPGRDAQAASGWALPIPLDEVTEVRVLGSDPGETLDADFGPVDG